LLTRRRGLYPIRLMPHTLRHGASSTASPTTFCKAGSAAVPESASSLRASRTWPFASALASQLGSVTDSAVPDVQSGEVGGILYTVTNLGASIGTALADAVPIAALTASFSRLPATCASMVD
jgi:hypothetical protein